MNTPISPCIPKTLRDQLGEHALLQALLETVSEQVVILDTEQRIIYCGAEFARLLGYPPEAVTGKPLGQFLPADPLATAAQPGVSAPRSSPVSDAPARYRHHDGTLIELSLSRAPLRDAHGRTRATLCMLQAPRDLRAQAAEEANHRVRNNLAIICALLDLEMLHAPESERQRLLISQARTRSLGLAYNLEQQGADRVDVGQLVQAVIDTVRALYVRTDSAATISYAAPVSLSKKRATYLSLALTELSIHLILCATAQGSSALPMITITAADDVLRILIVAPACPAGIYAGLTPESRELLDGLMQHSLGGTMEFDTDAPCRVVLSCTIG